MTIGQADNEGVHANRGILASPSGCIALLPQPAMIVVEGPSAGAGSKPLHCCLIGLNQVGSTGNRGPSFFLACNSIYCKHADKRPFPDA
jgi:hypothetical protein